MAKVFNLGTTKIEFDAGYIYVTEPSGARTQTAVAGILRALDIPTGLTYSQVQGLTALANGLAVLVRTLIHKEILNEDFLEEGEYNLLHITEFIEELGGDYGDPDLSVTA